MGKPLYKTNKRLNEATPLQKSTSKFTRKVNNLIEQKGLLALKIKKLKKQATIDYNDKEKLKEEIKQWKERFCVWCNKKIKGCGIYFCSRECSKNKKNMDWDIKKQCYIKIWKGKTSHKGGWKVYNKLSKGER